MAYCWLGTTKKSLNGHQTLWEGGVWAWDLWVTTTPWEYILLTPPLVLHVYKTLLHLRQQTHKQMKMHEIRNALLWSCDFANFIEHMYRFTHVRTVGPSCSSHPHAWISNWFGLSISIYQLVSPVKKTVHSWVKHLQKHWNQKHFTGNSAVRYFVSNYLLWGLRVAVNMTWVHFHG